MPGEVIRHPEFRGPSASAFCKYHALQQRCCRPLPREIRRTMRLAAAIIPSNLAVELEEVIHPAYNKYKTKGELAASELRRWRESMAEGVELPDPTPKSLFWFALGFIKFELVPEIVRYGWFLVWSRLCAWYYPSHKKLVLQGCKLDIKLQKKAYPEREIHVDRKIALRRFHWHMSPWENLQYRGKFVKDLIWKKLNLKGSTKPSGTAA